MIMKAVGVKDLKAHLSEYLREVRRGKTILVTDRSEVVAELRPAVRQAFPGIVGKLEEQADQGLLTLRSSDEPWKRPPAKTAVRALALDRILDDLRGDDV